jgi:hypothetical protein
VRVTDTEVAALVTAIVALLTALAGWVRALTRHRETTRRLELLETGRDPRDDVP